MRTVNLLRLLTRSALATLALLLMTGTGTVLAKTIYVDTGGNDAFSGLTPAQPKLTIAAALLIAEEGDVISIEAGVYTENVTIIVDDLTFESRPDAPFNTVVIDGDLENDAEGTSIGTSGDGDFEVTGNLVQTSGSLALGELPVAGDLLLADGSVTADVLDLSSNPALTIVRAGGSLTADVTFPANSFDVIYQGDQDVVSGDELPADLNGGELGVVLTDDATLTLSQEVTVGTLQVDADAVVDGTVVVETNVEGTGTAGTVVAVSAITIDDAITLTGALDIRNGGSVTLDDDVTVEDVLLVSGGTLVLAGNTLNVTGDFSRTGGTFTAAGASTLAFVGEGDATFAGGPNLVVANLLIDLDGTVAFTQDVNITSSFEIGEDATADLGARTVTVSGPAATVTNNGTFAQTEGVLLFSGTADDAVLEGDGVYNSITVLVGANDDVLLGSDILFAGTLNLEQGGIDAQGNDISPTGDNAQVTVNLAISGTNVENGDFNNEENEYDLQYTGDLAGATVAVGDEFALGFVRDITVSVTDGEVDASAADGGEILGDLVLEGVELADAYSLLLPVDDVAVQGSLQVGANATVDTGGDDTVELTLSGASHSVEGLVVGDATLRLEDSAIEITGSTEADDDAAQLPALLIAEGTAVTLTNIQVIDGDVTVEADASLALSLVEEASITGDVDVAEGGSIAFNSDVNYEGDFTAAEGASFSGSGTLVIAAVSTLGTNGEALPNLSVEDDVTLTSDVAVTGTLTEAGGTIDLDGSDLIVGSSIVSDGGLITTGAGNVVVETTTVSLTGNAEIEADAVQVEGTLTVTSDGDDDELTITADLELAGTLALGPNDVVLDGDLLSDGGAVTGTGTLDVQGGDIEPGADDTLDIPNLVVSGATTVTDGTLRITNSLVLNADLDADDEELVLAEGVDLTLGADAPLSGEVVFEGPYDLTVDVAQTAGSGAEVSSDVPLNNLAVNADYELNVDVTVNGTVSVDDAALSTAGGIELTLGDGATLSLEGDDPANLVGGADLTATNYNIVYGVDADGPIGPDEIVADAMVTTITVAGADVSAGTVNSFNNLVVESGSFDMVGNSISVAGDLSFTAGANPTFVNTGADAALTFDGANDAMLSINGNWDIPAAGIEIVLDKDEDDAVVTLSGGVMNFTSNAAGTAGEEIVLQQGVFETSGNAAFFLFQNDVSQGFEQSGGLIAGNVRKRVQAGDPFATGRSARFEFPVGDAMGNERPLAFTFRNNLPTATNITVNHEAMSPGGSVGLPITSTDPDIGGYPNWYWSISSSTSLGPAQLFDLELTGSEPFDLSFEDEEDLVIIRRFEGNAEQNPWTLQGEEDDYSNLISVVDGDTTVVVRALNTQGGLVTQGARFTIGFPSRTPALSYTDTSGTTVPLLNDTIIEVEEGEERVVDIQYSALDVGQEATLEVIALPEFASLEDAEDGTATLTLSPGFEDAGTYEATLAATDPDGTTEVTFTIEVINVDRPIIIENAPADTVEVIALREFTFSIIATDPDAGDITFELDPDTLGATLTVDGDTATFSFVPEFDQIGDTLNFTINVSDGVDTVAVEFTLIVTEAELVWGDVSLNGEVSAFDAALVLQHVTGQSTLSAAAQMVADVSDNGSISAFDAALILQYDAEIIDCFPVEEDCESASKTIAAAAGELTWGTIEAAETGAMLYIPVSLAGDVSNVYSVELTATLDQELAVVKSVSGTALPNGWQVAYAVSDNGQLRVALAGTTPLANAGEIARIAIELKDENAQASVTAEGRINENGMVYLGELAAREIPAEFELGSNYPNPFNPTTTFSYSLPESGMVSIQVFDITGRRVRVLVNEEKDAGIYRVQWDGRNDAGQQVASGMYLYQIRSGSFVDAKKMMLVK